MYKLWDNKSRQALEKLHEKNPKFVYFDTRLASYSKLRDVVRGQPPQKDIDFVRIDSAPVIAAIDERATTWVRDYGSILADLSRAKLQDLDVSADERLPPRFRVAETIKIPTEGGQKWTCHHIYVDKALESGLEPLRLTELGPGDTDLIVEALLKQAQDYGKLVRD